MGPEIERKSNGHCDIEGLNHQKPLRPGNGIRNGNTGRETEVVRILRGPLMGYPGHHLFKGVEVTPPLDPEKEKEGTRTEIIFVRDVTWYTGDKVYNNLERVMPSKAELLKEAQECNDTADRIYKRIQKDPSLLEPYITENGERAPSGAATALGALRQRARRLREEAGAAK